VGFLAVIDLKRTITIEEEQALVNPLGSTKALRFPTESCARWDLDKAWFDGFYPTEPTRPGS
jgi:hypothetical protein